MYSEVLEAWRREWESAELAPLPDDFFERAERYLASLDERIGTAEGLILNLLKRERAIVQVMVEDIKELRRRKGVELLVRDEKIDVVAIAKKGRIAETLKPKEGVEGGQVIVRVLEPIPEIVGPDLKYYGPFKPEDIASLPSEVAEPLTARGYLSRLEERSG